MARSITASVGMGGVSLPTDTKTVQQLLDNVPAAQGGPLPLLKDEGMCGPLTKSAIQRFQLKHFGWKGADGRVDPNGPSLAKLNEFDKQPAIPVPAKPTQPALRESTDFFVMHMSSKIISAGREEDLFFQVFDTRNDAIAVYFIDVDRRGKPIVAVPQGRSWVGSGGPFKIRKARRIDDLEVDSAWMTDAHAGKISSNLVLLFPEGMVTIPMNHHLMGPGGKIPVPARRDDVVASTGAAGRFRLVEMR